MKKITAISTIAFLSAIIILLLCRPLSRQTTESEIRSRDTTVYNINYRDTTIYNIQKKDSIIIDFALIPAHDTITLNDTVFVILPLSSYHFGDSLYDIYVTGYNVTLDSILSHYKEVIVTTKEEIIIPPKKLTVNAGISILNYDGWYLLLDGNANFRINETWSIDTDIGIIANGENLSPFAKAGFRYKFRRCN